MKQTFAGYYRPTEQEFSDLWKDCLFVLDANVLLCLYRYSSQTTEQLLKILEKIKDRVWVPHQSAYEYHKNRLGTIEGLKGVCEAVAKTLDTTQKNLENELNQYRRRHPVLDPMSLLKKINRTFESVKKEIRDLPPPDMRDKDPIRDSITALLDGRVGSPYTPKRLEQIYEEGKTRYRHNIPPGYMDEAPKDRKQEDAERYGDLILWYQVIDKASAEKKGIIFLTEDRKEDWWQKLGGEIVSPHPKLIEEMRDKANVAFYMYRIDPFREWAEKYLELEIDQAAKNELREVRESDEERMKKAAVDASFLRGEGIEPLYSGLSWGIAQAAADYARSISTQTEENMARLAESAGWAVADLARAMSTQAERNVARLAESAGWVTADLARAIRTEAERHLVRLAESVKGSFRLPGPGEGGAVEKGDDAVESAEASDKSDD